MKKILKILNSETITTFKDFMTLLHHSSESLWFSLDLPSVFCCVLSLLAGPKRFSSLYLWDSYGRSFFSGSTNLFILPPENAEENYKKNLFIFLSDEFHWRIFNSLDFYGSSEWNKKSFLLRGEDGEES